MTKETEISVKYLNGFPFVNMVAKNVRTTSTEEIEVVFICYRVAIMSNTRVIIIT